MQFIDAYWQIPVHVLVSCARMTKFYTKMPDLHAN